tara:strand:+ start:117 stop:941 length:825 start_codon:yes stop_codon:yes gene_type:complete
MKVLYSVEEIQLWRNQISNLKIGFVPTMGALHEGHLELVNECKAKTDISVVSIFVNPTQFNDQNDLKKYPSSLENDLRLLQKANVDVVFIPDYADLYFGEDQLEVNIKGIDLKLEGESRPGHFDGVIRVLSIFFKLLNPSLSFFGEKDFQQVLVVEQLVDQYFSHIQLVRCPTSREPNGLARSSRNKHLSSEEFIKAGEISQTLNWFKTHVNQNNIKEMLLSTKEKLSNSFDVEYLELRDEVGLNQVTDSLLNSRLFVAVKLSNIRLIDNIKIG